MRGKKSQDYFSDSSLKFLETRHRFLGMFCLFDAPEVGCAEKSFSFDRGGGKFNVSCLLSGLEYFV